MQHALCLHLAYRFSQPCLQVSLSLAGSLVLGFHVHVPIFIIIYTLLFVLLLVVIGRFMYLLGYNLATTPSGYPGSLFLAHLVILTLLSFIVQKQPL